MNYSIPGMILPALPSAIGMVFFWKEIRKHTNAIAWCTILGMPMVIWRGYIGWDDGSLHLIPFFLIYLVICYGFNKIATHPIAAFTGTWLSIIAVDITGSYAEAAFHNGKYMIKHMLWPLDLIGADEWRDALLMYPLISVLLVIVILPAWGRAMETKIYQRVFRNNKNNIKLPCNNQDK